jgi:hypothetical protein
MRRSATTFEGPIIGYRAWRPGPRGTLRSLTGGDHWGPGVRTAYCDRQMRAGQAPHSAPDRRCDCGVHAVSSIALVRRAVARVLLPQRIVYAIVVGILLALAIVAGAQPSWADRAQGVALLLLACGTTIGGLRVGRSIVYGAVLAWGDQVALDVVRGGVQIRAQHARPIALMSSPIADSIAARMGLPSASEKALPSVAREVSDGAELDPEELAQRGPIGWALWAIGMALLGVLHIGCLIALGIARSIVFAVALAGRSIVALGAGR